LKGFTGGTLYGTHILESTLPVGVALATQQQLPLPTDRLVVDEEIDGEEDIKEEQAGEDRDDAVLGAYFSVLEFSYDNATSHLTVGDNVHL
jgi:hypothetical protein